MPKPTPEVQQAQANFKAAQQALQAATFAQWEKSGVPLGWRIWAAFIGLAVGMMLSIPCMMFWSDHLFQQQWAAKVRQNPRLANLSGYHHSWTASLVFLLTPIFWGLALHKQLRLLKGYPQALKTLAFSAGLGLPLGVLVAYFMSRPLFSPI